MDSLTSSRDIHVFCDATERTYDSVAYLRGTEDLSSMVKVTFLILWSRLAPMKQQSILIWSYWGVASQGTPDRALASHPLSYLLVRLHHGPHVA